MALSDVGLLLIEALVAGESVIFLEPIKSATAKDCDYALFHNIS